jgi:hypothetical protein
MNAIDKVEASGGKQNLPRLSPGDTMRRAGRSAAQDDKAAA